MPLASLPAAIQSPRLAQLARFRLAATTSVRPKVRLTPSPAEPRLGRTPAIFHDDRGGGSHLPRAPAGYLGAGSGPPTPGPAASRIHVFPGSPPPSLCP